MACAVAAEDTAAEAEHGHVEVERGVAAAWSEGEAHPPAAWFTLSVFFVSQWEGERGGGIDLPHPSRLQFPSSSESLSESGSWWWW
jgi:hypothetical protein